MKFVRLLFFVLVAGVLPTALRAQCPGNSGIINVLSTVHIVNGVENSQLGVPHYYIGFGDSLIVNTVSNGTLFYVDNGGYLECNFTAAQCGIIAANYSTVNFIAGGVDSSYADIQANITGINLFSCSPIIFILQGQGSNLDSFNMYVQPVCSGPIITTTVGTFNNGMSVLTDFGDGSTSSSIIQQNIDGGYAVGQHSYSNAGNYLIKQILYNGITPVDSMVMTYIQDECSLMPIRFYYDVNANCEYDAGIDQTPWFPIMLEVESNGVVVDTISALSGVDYIAHGNTQDVFTFHILDLPGNLISSCPLTPFFSDTFQIGSNNIKYIGFGSTPSGNFDLKLNVISMAGVQILASDIVAENVYAGAQSATLIINHDSSLSFNQSSPPPTTYGPGFVSWDLNFSLLSQQIPISLNLAGALQTGYVLNTTYNLIPVVGDVVPNNNTLIVIDTVVGGWDPNAIYVEPGCINSGGDTLEYTITFENLGNGIAQNIYILDTISEDLMHWTMEMQFASHDMNVEKRKHGTDYIYKFNFPNINLPDSSDHVGRHGWLKYKIVTNWFLQSGGNPITNRAGIYFDYNDPVITNTAYTDFCTTTSINETTVAKSGITVYPNPATEELTIKTEKQFTSFTITNGIGQVMMERDMKGKELKVDIKSLAIGIYYISLEGQGGSEVRKFVKL